MIFKLSVDRITWTFYLDVLRRQFSDSSSHSSPHLDTRHVLFAGVQVHGAPSMWRSKNASKPDVERARCLQPTGVRIRKGLGVLYGRSSFPQSFPDIRVQCSSCLFQAFPLSGVPSKGGPPRILSVLYSLFVQHEGVRERVETFL